MTDLISRQAALQAMDTWDKFGCGPDGRLVRCGDDKHYVLYVHYDDMVHAIKHLPSVHPEPMCVAKVTLTDEQVKEAFEKAKCEILAVQSAQPERENGKCVWCDSPFRIEYYWIDREGCTASFQDEECHIVASGIAKFCPNCGRKLRGEQDD